MCNHLDLLTHLHFFRGASQAKRGDLRMLSGALSGHHVHNQDAEEDAVLLLQPHHPLHPHRFHGCAWLHPAPGLWGEAFFRWCSIFMTQLLLLPLKNKKLCGLSRQEWGVDWLFTLAVFAKHQHLLFIHPWSQKTRKNNCYDLFPQHITFISNICLQY